MTGVSPQHVRSISGIGSSHGKLIERARRAGGPAQLLGIRQSGAWLLALVLAVLPAAAAFLAGAQPWGVGLVALLSFVAAGFVVRGALNQVAGELVRPLLQSLDALEAMRRGVAVNDMRSAGPPLVCALAENLNAAISAIDHRNRLSQASLLTAEAAFDRIHSVLQSLTEGVVLIDNDGKVVLANPCVRRLLVDDGRPIEGRPLTALLQGELAEQVEQGLATVRQGGHPQVQVMGLQAGERVFDLTVVEARSSKLGPGFGVVVALVDVTRNHEISKLKDQFLSSISHELRTPLTNICAFTEILEQVSPDNENEWREFVSIVNTESQRLKGMVDDILQSGRLHSGQVQWRLEPIHLGELVEMVVDLFRGPAAAKSIELSHTCTGDDLFARGDRERVNEVLSRLLDNAVKFTPEGGAVRVDVREAVDAVEVAVCDSGPGVPAEHHETVFERFRQIGDHLTDKPSGAGLGLPICRGFIDGMGGSIWCEESDLGGSQFRFLLPGPNAPEQQGSSPTHVAIRHVVD